ncbi:MAG: hypothetical protein ACRDVC_07765 [Acidimicrobiales bacterium]
MGREEWRTHLALFASLVICSAGFWFELGRAERGDHLSWAYVFEWPLLGIVAVYMWWRLLHPRSPESSTKKVVPLAPEFDGMRIAWQEHQRELAESQRVESSPEDPREQKLE